MNTRMGKAQVRADAATAIAGRIGANVDIDSTHTGDATGNPARVDLPDGMCPSGRRLLANGDAIAAEATWPARLQPMAPARATAECPVTMS